ncbi:MAG: purine-nucleoside phosphorylase, partial [Acidimicrobiia bacterium]
MTYEALQATAAEIRALSGRDEHRVVAVLGSGLSGYADHLPGAVAIPYSELPGFPVPKVAGHAGTAYSVELRGVPILILAGRAHFYEGYGLD